MIDNDMNTNIDISIIVAIYNHEKYIKQAINGILAQKKDFNYEVLIGEDCSTDNSRKILQELEPDLPSNFQIFYREHNYGPLKNFIDLYGRSRGRYFIVLEGDDYWIYDKKLQSEYDFLETHSEYISVAHNTLVVDQNGSTLNVNYPECKDYDYTFDHFLHGILPGQTTTKLTRNYYKFDILKGADLNVGQYPGDQREAFLLSVNGKVYCIQEKWSAYRLVTSGGSSFSANYKYDYEVELFFWTQLYEYLIKYYPNDKYKLQKIGERYYWHLFVGKLKMEKCVKKYEKGEYIKFIPNKVKLNIYILENLFNTPFRKLRGKMINNSDC